MCQTFPLLYYCEPHVLCRTSYRFLKRKVQNSAQVYVGNAENILRFKVSNVSIESGWNHSYITFTFALFEFGWLNKTVKHFKPSKH